eukprot:TRINITY_DN500_c0_g1_i1.p1 TRINITY_DN500_c0_g1~~TRINITY_DN500_c0_g1_i1.p1  ORF type:complete len:286 (-),score=55.33 TRINITY_DN500_c0_g1_i1:669-1526(-)
MAAPHQHNVPTRPAGGGIRPLSSRPHPASASTPSSHLPPPHSTPGAHGRTAASMPPGAANGASQRSSVVLPRDALVVKAMLQEMGVENYESRVVNQFLEFMYRYITDVLGDARVYSEHAGREKLDTDDITLAIQSRAKFTFSRPPPREVLMTLARVRNSIPLPLIAARPGLPLPPEMDTLTLPTWQIRLPPATVRPAAMADVEEEAGQPSRKRKADADGQTAGDEEMEGSENARVDIEWETLEEAPKTASTPANQRRRLGSSGLLSPSGATERKVHFKLTTKKGR